MKFYEKELESSIIALQYSHPHHHHPDVFAKRTERRLGYIEQKTFNIPGDNQEVFHRAIKRKLQSFYLRATCLPRHSRLGSGSAPGRER